MTLTNIFVLSECYSNSSFKEQSAHVASVKKILESHASFLMSGKELSKLVAFVKGTQFDLVVREPNFFSHIVFTLPLLGIWESIMIISGISSERKIWKCSLGEFCFRAWTDRAEGNLSGYNCSRSIHGCG